MYKDSSYYKPRRVSDSEKVLLTNKLCSYLNKIESAITSYYHAEIYFNV